MDSLVAYVRGHAEPPDSLVLRAFESHHLVFVGDVHPAAEPKRLVARLVPALVAQARLDALVLEVPFEQQPVIDAYLASDPEDVAVLLGHPLTLRAHWGASREYLEIYRGVWSANRGPPQVASEQGAVAYRDGPSRGATRWFAVMRARVEPAVAAPFAVALDRVLNAWPRALLDPEQGPISLTFEPAAYRLMAAVDAYLYLGLGDPITPLPTSP